MFEYVVVRGDVGGGFRRCGLVGAGVFLGAGFEGSNGSSCFEVALSSSCLWF